jgi:hypothetical protein
MRYLISIIILAAMTACGGGGDNEDSCCSVPTMHDMQPEER